MDDSSSTVSRSSGGAASLCHDMRSHLAAGLALTDLLDVDDRLDAGLHEPLSRLRQQLLGLAELVDSELDEARRQTEPVDVADLVERWVRLAGGATAPPPRVRVASRPVVMGRRLQLQRAVGNLLDNAVRAGGARPVRVGVDQWATQAEVVVDDDGPGFGRIPRGTGQGLEQVRSAALAHGGTLDLTDRHGGGTRARLVLPLAVGASR